MKYEGSCHCGNNAYEVDGTIDSVIECNCSICRRNGYLLWFVPEASLKMKKSSSMGTYTFNKHAIKHNFCTNCGSSMFGNAIDPRTNQPTAAINIRCLPDVDLTSVKHVPWDGKSI